MCVLEQPEVWEAEGEMTTIGTASRTSGLCNYIVEERMQSAANLTSALCDGIVFVNALELTTR